MNTKLMTTALVLAACASPPQVGMKRDCGDTAYGASVVKDHIVPLFSSSQYASFRAKHQIRTLSAGTQARLLTKVEECRPSVDALIANFEQNLPATSEMRNGPVDHAIFEVGPYEAILFAGGEIENILSGFVGAAVFDRQTHTLIAQTGY